MQLPRVNESSDCHEAGHADADAEFPVVPPTTRATNTGSCKRPRLHLEWPNLHDNTFLSKPWEKTPGQQPSRCTTPPKQKPVHDLRPNECRRHRRQAARSIGPLRGQRSQCKYHEARKVGCSCEGWSVIQSRVMVGRLNDGRRDEEGSVKESLRYYTGYWAHMSTIEMLPVLRGESSWWVPGNQAKLVYERECRAREYPEQFWREWERSQEDRNWGDCTLRALMGILPPPAQLKRKRSY